MRLREHPLFLRETVLWEGRSVWRSPFVLVLLLSLAAPLIEAVRFVVLWSMFNHVPYWSVSAWNCRPNEWLCSAVNVTLGSAWALAAALAARSHARDLSEGRRDQLHLASLDTFGSKLLRTGLWTIGPLGASLLLFAHRLLQPVLVWLFGDSQSLLCFGYYCEPASVLPSDVAFEMLAVAITEALDLLSMVAAFFLALGAFGRVRFSWSEGTAGLLLALAILVPPVTVLLSFAPYLQLCALPFLAAGALLASRQKG